MDSKSVKLLNPVNLMGLLGIAITVFYLLTLPIIGAGLMLLNMLNRSTIPIFAPPKHSVVSQQIGLPKNLDIPRLGVNAGIESVGLDKTGAMDVPKNADNVAWYNLGSSPGQIGNAVLAGHYDKVTGAPAVFYTLNKLNIGDEISVTDEFGNKFNYKVTGKKIYAYNNLPLNYIFGSSDKARLNLITCSGTWDQANKNYSNREVIYSEKVN
jgi:sortase A